MSNRKINKSMPARRSIPAISLQNFRSVRFRHKAEDRGGATNTMVELMADVDDTNLQDDGYDDLD